MAVSNYKILKQVYSNIDDFKRKFEAGQGFLPIDAEIRVDWKCNAQCKMCGLHNYIDKSSKNRRIEMDIVNILHLLNELKEMGCVSVTFSGGEPTLRKDLEKMIGYAAHTLGMTVSINTNGYLLDKVKLKEYLDSGIDSFTFSILSPIEEIHDDIMGLKSGLKRIKESIDYINEYNLKNTKKVRIYVNTVILNSNIESLIHFKEFYKKHRIDHLNLSPASIFTEWDEWSADNEKLRPTLEQVKNLKNNIIPELQKDDWELYVQDPFGITDEEINKNLHVKFSDVPNQCYIPMLHTVIQSNGDVIPCCYAPDEFILGNILEQSFHEIWNDENYTKFRIKCRNVQWNMCASCRQYKLINEKITKKIGE